MDSNFPLLTPSAANFINEKSSDFHSASGRGNTRTQPVKGCRNQKKKKRLFHILNTKNGFGSVQIVVEYEYSNNYLHINWRIVKVEVQAFL